MEKKISYQLFKKCQNYNLPSLWSADPILILLLLYLLILSTTPPSVSPICVCLNSYPGARERIPLPQEMRYFPFKPFCFIFSARVIKYPPADRIARGISPAGLLTLCMNPTFAFVFSGGDAGGDLQPSRHLQQLDQVSQTRKWCFNENCCCSRSVKETTTRKRFLSNVRRIEIKWNNHKNVGNPGRRLETILQQNKKSKVINNNLRGNKFELFPGEPLRQTTSITSLLDWVWMWSLMILIHDVRLLHTFFQLPVSSTCTFWNGGGSAGSLGVSPASVNTMSSFVGEWVQGAFWESQTPPRPPCQD